MLELVTKSQGIGDVNLSGSLTRQVIVFFDCLYWKLIAISERSGCKHFGCNFAYSKYRSNDRGYGDQDA
jgi:hypothetical protein